ncbi:hypothetical protein HK101_006851, partial [Irineochytrium annulatum]
MAANFVPDAMLTPHVAPAAKPAATAAPAAKAAGLAGALDAFAGAVGLPAAAGVPKAEGKHHRRAGAITAVQALAAYATAAGLNAANLAQTVTVTNSGTDTIISGASFAVKPVVASPCYYQTPTTLEMAWNINVDTLDSWHDAFVSMTTGQVLGVSDWQSQSVFDSDAYRRNRRDAGHDGDYAHVHRREPAPAPDFSHFPQHLDRRQAGTSSPTNPPTSYSVIPIGMTSLLDNKGQTTVNNPADVTASPLGWHDTGNGQGAISSTFGNNVAAQQNFANAPNPLNNT